VAEILLAASDKEAYDASHLPDEPTTVPGLEQFVVDLRLDAAHRAAS
jgi:hypothetical protein